MTISNSEKRTTRDGTARAPARRRVLDPVAVAVFRRLVRDAGRHHHRPMPWRADPTPYHVVVSEIMLQQTQVARVLGKYATFIALFPDFQSMASAPLADVLRAWQGLGYNRRARSLWEVARAVVAKHHGVLPAGEADLRALPGIGSYTAGAIMAFAFNLPAVFIETNIRTVYMHRFFRDQQNVHDRDIMPLVEKTLDRRNPRRWYNALMDYGAWLKGRGINLNRKNPGYRPQSRFEGSTRQLRGGILRRLAVGGTDVATLGATTGRPVAEVRAVLASLVRDGLVRHLGRCHTLA